MRLKSSFYNVFFGIGSSLVINLLNFIARSIFIYYLGSSYLGINGVMQNILQVLSLTELGVGTAINYSLYKPLAEKDTEKVSILMSFYKKTYIFIGLSMFILGLFVIPFLDLIVPDVEKSVKIVLIYMLFLSDTSLSYLFTYKRTLINADQKQYKLVKYTTIFKILLYVFQSIIIALYKNYIFYLVVMIIMRVLENITINNYVAKEYKNINFNTKGKLNKFELKNIRDNIFAVMFHKLGDVAVNSTDNLILSSFIGVIEVGIYSNYLLIIGFLKQLSAILFNGVTASLGNLVACENDRRKYEIFKVMNLISYWIFIFSTICLLFLFNPFIEIWLGPKYLFNMNIVIVLVLNYYITSIRIPVATIKGAAGVYKDDKYVPLIQAFMNLVLSIFLVKKLGIIGIFIGTIITSLILPSWFRPYIVYKKIFNKNCKEYFIDYIYKFIILVGIAFLISQIIKLVVFKNIYVNFGIKLIICVIIPNIIMYYLNRDKDEFKYIENILKNILRRKNGES